MRKIMAHSATLFGLGEKVPAPGTWGSFIAMLLAYPLMKLGPVPYMVICVLFLFYAIFACEFYEQIHGAHDSSAVIIDEVIGYWIAVVWLPINLKTLLVGFALFRLFDIWKPLFIGMIDRKVKGGVGTVVDDVAAGLVVNLILQYVLLRTDWLGAL
jgi:phosphatidylglycerophosphatase A